MLARPLIREPEVGITGDQGRGVLDVGRGHPVDRAGNQFEVFTGADAEPARGLIGIEHGNAAEPDRRVEALDRVRLRPPFAEQMQSRAAEARPVERHEERATCRVVLPVGHRVTQQVDRRQPLRQAEAEAEHGALLHRADEDDLLLNGILGHLRDRVSFHAQRGLDDAGRDGQRTAGLVVDVGELRVARADPSRKITDVDLHDLLGVVMHEDDVLAGGDADAAGFPLGVHAAHAGDEHAVHAAEVLEAFQRDGAVSLDRPLQAHLDLIVRGGPRLNVVAGHGKHDQPLVESDEQALDGRLLDSIVDPRFELDDAGLEPRVARRDSGDARTHRAEPEPQFGSRASTGCLRA